MKAWKKAAILAAICSGILVSPWIMQQIQGQNGNPPSDEPSDPVLKTSGTLARWRTMSNSAYPYKNVYVETSGGVSGYVFVLVPFANVIFDAPTGTKVVAYELTDLAVPDYYNYAYKASDGWWVANSQLKNYDQVVIDCLLQMADT